MSDLKSQEEMNKDLWEAVRLNKADAARRVLKRNADVNHMAAEDSEVCYLYYCFPFSCIYTSLSVTDHNRIDAGMQVWVHFSCEITRQERSYSQ